MVAHQILQRIAHRPGHAVLSSFGIAMQVILVIVLAGLTGNSAMSSLVDFVLVAGFLLTFLGTYRAVMTRTHEIGVLKSLGASKGYISGVVLGETSIFCVAGIFAGTAGAYFTRMLIHFYSSLSLCVTFTWITRAALMATAGSLLGTGLSAWNVMRREPAQTLDYE